MNLHDIAPPRPHEGVPLFTRNVYNEIGSQSGKIHDSWIENGAPLSYWTNDRYAFVILLFESTKYLLDPLYSHTSWDIWGDHTIEARP